MTTVFKRTRTLKKKTTHYCPGCGHSIAHRLLAETIDELGIREITIGIAPVGCAVLAYDYLDIDMVEVAHGRAPAVATGMKRTNPDKIIFSYQGDGDLASIGAGEILHAVHRGENITVIFINNAIFGMTGGQMAPTTLTGQTTSTTQQGRDPIKQGYPLRMSELLAILPGAIYVERTSLHDTANIRNTKRAIKHAFQLQMDNKTGLSFVEILSPCPSAWKLTPVMAMKWLKDNMLSEFPLGKLKG